MALKLLNRNSAEIRVRIAEKVKIICIAADNSLIYKVVPSSELMA
jgi:hypothetical protein